MANENPLEKHRWTNYRGTVSCNITAVLGEREGRALLHRADAHDSAIFTTKVTGNSMRCTPSIERSFLAVVSSFRRGRNSNDGSFSSVGDAFPSM